MIIKGSRQPRNYRKLLWLLPFAAVLGLYLFLTYQTIDPIAEDAITSTAGEILLACDLETDDGTFFTADGYTLDGLPNVTDTFARSGTRSMALDSNHQYGLTTWFLPPDHDATYHVTVWRFNPEDEDSYLVVAGPDNKDLYLSQPGAKEVEESGWEAMHLVFQVPPHIDSVVIYCYVGNEAKAVYYDDLQLAVSNLHENGAQFDVPTLELYLDDLALEKLRTKRKEAWNSGLLISSEEDWTKAKIIYEEEEHPAKVRLKGDWLDHLRGDQWSFRVKLKDPHALWGMTTFNLQKPDTRGFLDEWVYHKMLNEHDILNPRYTFVVLDLNHKVLGFYACEEHFRKELVESQRRREGPILKFSEDRMWLGVARAFEEVGRNRFPLGNDKENAFMSAPVETFNPAAYDENPDLEKLRSRGEYLLGAFRDQSLPFDQIFDTEIVGKYLAIVDICGAFHSLTWHNQRWYYNPLSDRLEPIGFDGYGITRHQLSAGSAILADEAYRSHKDQFEPFKRLFEDPQIVKWHVYYLDSLADKNHLDSFMARHRDQIDAYTSALEEEYLKDVITPGALYDRATKIRLSIHPYSESLKVYRMSDQRLYFVNHHCLPLEVMSDGNPILFPSRDFRQGVYHPDKSPRSREVQFRVLGLDSLYKTEIRQGSAGASMAQSEDSDTSKCHPFLRKLDARYTLQSGETSDPIIVPDRLPLTITSGTRLNLQQGAYLLVEGKLHSEGTEENPVVISSSDGSGAVVVRGAKDPCVIRHTVFQGLGNVDRDGYMLTGGVTFYQSDVLIDRSIFKENTGEDALNVFRSNFELSNCFFQNTAFDAFDADFCTGKLFGCHFKNIGNDAIDFSGSQASIEDCNLDQMGDKGVSVGEESTVEIVSCRVERASVGVASKDLSRLTIRNIEFVKVGTAFTAYQKKPAFGPASIEVENHIVKNIGRLHLIEAGSSITFHPLP